MNDRLRALLQPDTAVTTADETARTDEPAEGRASDGCCEWLRGARERAVALEYERLEGRGPWPAPDYALLTGRWWDGDGFRAEYASGLKVTVKGWGLRRVYELFLRNRLTRLVEQGMDPVRESQAQSWVRSIEVELPRTGEGE